MPQGPGYPVDQILIDIGGDDPLGADAQRRGRRHARIGALGNDGGGKGRMGKANPGRLGPVDGKQTNAEALGELGDGVGRIARHQEDRLEPARAHQVAGRTGFEVVVLDIRPREPVGSEDDLGIDQRARALFANRHGPAPEVGDIVDVGIGADDDLETLGIKIGDRPQIRHLALGAIDALTVIAPIGDVGLGETRLERAFGDGVDVVHRAAGRLGDGDQAGNAAAAAALAGKRAGGIADDAGDETADGEIGAPGGAGADAEEGRLLRPAQARAQAQRHERRAGAPYRFHEPRVVAKMGHRKARNIRSG